MELRHSRRAFLRVTLALTGLVTAVRLHSGRYTGATQPNHRARRRGASSSQANHRARGRRADPARSPKL